MSYTNQRLDRLLKSIDRSRHWRCSVKKGILKSFKNFKGNHLYWITFLIKFRLSDLLLYEKETPTQTFSCEICEIFESSYFEEHLLSSASELRKLFMMRILILKVH